MRWGHGLRNLAMGAITSHEQLLRIGVDRHELDTLEAELDHAIDGVDATSADAEAYLDRLHCVAREMDAETDRVRRDAASGVVAPDFILANALGQMNGLLQIPGSQSRFVQSLARRAREKKLDGDWGGRATVIVLSEIYPALTRQRDVLKALAAKAGSDAGAWRFKDGEPYYSWCLKQGTSTNLTAEEIHQVGLDQNRAIEALMDGLLKAQGLTQGTVGERMIALGKDPRYLFPNTEAGRAAVIARSKLAAGESDPFWQHAFGKRPTEQLFDISEDPAIVYEHKWALGDMVIWDNWCSIHARKDFPREEPRLMRRLTIEGQTLSF